MLDNLVDGKPLKQCVKQILVSENLSAHYEQIKTIATELGINDADCAAVLLHLLQTGKTITQVKQNVSVSQPHIKMVRYRLDVGTKHDLNLEILTQVLVEESGVDKSNINNVKIQELYTLIDLPDQMPLDIFQHLKTVEINQHKLDIRRVKSRNKKRGNNHRRRGQPATVQSDNKLSSQVI